MNLKCIVGLHDWSKDCQRCARCGRERNVMHEWNWCKCLKCERTRHKWSEDCERCSICGTTREAQHDWSQVCGTTREAQHDWSQDCERCSKCLEVRPNKHQWRDAHCKICGKPRNERRAQPPTPMKRVDLEDLKEEANDIVMERAVRSVAMALDEGLSKDERVANYIDAVLGSVDVFIQRFGLSLDSAVELYCTTTSGRSHSKQGILDLFKKTGHPLANSPHLSSQTVQTPTGPVRHVQGQCSSCGRAGLGPVRGGVVVSDMLDYLATRAQVCTGCGAVFCPDCAFKRYHSKCPNCGSRIES